MASFPAFYDPERIGTLLLPDTAAIAAAAAAAHLAPASRDTRHVQLLLIDMQVDFCHPTGSLYVPGALGDLRRVIEFIYEHAADITEIICSLDSHLPNQIFFPSWWVDADGNHPAPFTLISRADVDTGRWRPLFERDWSREYVARLEEDARKLLTIWPYHVLLGSPGHALDPELWSAVMWHALARKTEPRWLLKGSDPRTEHYSIIKPEVVPADMPQAGVNESLLARLAAADQVFVAGEAESHCVLETVADIVEALADQPGAVARVALLRDCTSPVVHPDIDFHALAQARLAELARQGLRLVDSTEVGR
ncbi:MAG: nicotinamidase [Anaerolineae bacterium]